MRGRGEEGDWEGRGKGRVRNMGREGKVMKRERRVEERKGERERNEGIREREEGGENGKVRI